MKVISRHINFRRITKKNRYFAKVFASKSLNIIMLQNFTNESIIITIKEKKGDLKLPLFQHSSLVLDFTEEVIPGILEFYIYYVEKKPTNGKCYISLMNNKEQHERTCTTRSILDR